MATNSIRVADGLAPPQQTPQDRTERTGSNPPAVTVPAGDPPITPALARMGQQDPMSAQQQQSMPGATQASGIWKQRVGAAKAAWGELTDDELLQTEGHLQKLAGLVQERYAITRNEAETQIKQFFSQYKAV